MASTSRAIRKRPVVTYSKKARTFLDSDDLHTSKRVRLSTSDNGEHIGEDGEGDKVPVASETIIASDSSVSTPDDTLQNLLEDAPKDDEESAYSSPPSPTMESELSLRGTTTTTATAAITAKSASFTLSTRRKPLFKRNVAKSSDTDNTHSPAAPSTQSQQQPRNLVQMQIDLDGIGAPKISCKECGMQYVPSAAEDAKLHKRYHAQVAEGLEFGSSKGQGAIVWEGKMGDPVAGGDAASTKTTGRPSGAAGEKENTTSVPITRYFSSGRKDKTIAKKFPQVGRSSASTSTSNTSSTSCCVLEVTRRCTPSEKKKAAEFLRFANRELSAQEVSEKLLWGTTGDGTAEGARGEQFKIYLYLEGTKCVGLCLVEKIKEAQWAAVPESKDEYASGETEKVAFSQPTDSGAWFALGWVNENRRQNEKTGRDVDENDGFLVYLDSV
ncbi:hypothetical protein ABW20_dc0108100 [Dactylellina cionopaga]|nr:hypothetical protein ABW20_dc0108100 [Dactylellina cionopaga]